MNVKKTQQQEKGEDDYSLESLRIFQHDYFPNDTLRRKSSARVFDQAVERSPVVELLKYCRASASQEEMDAKWSQLLETCEKKVKEKNERLHKEEAEKARQKAEEELKLVLHEKIIKLKEEDQPISSHQELKTVERERLLLSPVARILNFSHIAGTVDEDSENTQNSLVCNLRKSTPLRLKLKPSQKTPTKTQSQSKRKKSLLTPKGTSPSKKSQFFIPKKSPFSHDIQEVFDEIEDMEEGVLWIKTDHKDNEKMTYPADISNTQLCNVIRRIRKRPSSKRNHFMDIEQ